MIYKGLQFCGKEPSLNLLNTGTILKGQRTTPLGGSKVFAKNPISSHPNLQTSASCASESPIK